MSGNRGDGNIIIRFFQNLYEKVAALFSREGETPSASNKGRLDDQPTALETRPSTSGVTSKSAPPQDAPSASNKGRLEEQPAVLEDTSGTFNETEEEDRSTS